MRESILNYILKHITMANKNYIEVEGVKISERLIAFLKDLQMNDNEAVRNTLRDMDELSGLLLDLNEKCEAELPNNECLEHVREIRFYKCIIESIAV